MTRLIAVLLMLAGAKAFAIEPLDLSSRQTKDAAPSAASATLEVRIARMFSDDQAPLTCRGFREEGDHHWPSDLGFRTSRGTFPIFGLGSCDAARTLEAMSMIAYVMCQQANAEAGWPVDDDGRKYLSEVLGQIDSGCRKFAGNPMYAEGLAKIDELLERTNSLAAAASTRAVPRLKAAKLAADSKADEASAKAAEQARRLDREREASERQRAEALAAQEAKEEAEDEARRDRENTQRRCLMDNRALAPAVALEIANGSHSMCQGLAGHNRCDALLLACSVKSQGNAEEDAMCIVRHKPSLIGC